MTFGAAKSGPRSALGLSTQELGPCVPDVWREPVPWVGPSLKAEVAARWMPQRWQLLAAVTVSPLGSPALQQPQARQEGGWAPPSLPRVGHPSLYCLRMFYLPVFVLSR